MDLSKKMVFFTLDVIGTLGTGQSFGMLREDRDIDNYVKSSEEGLHATAMVSGLRLNWLMGTPIIGKALMPKPGDGTGFGAMMQTCFARVDQRAAEEAAYAAKGDEEVGDGSHKMPRRRRDMLASFIRHKLTGDDLRSEVLESLIAGSDTTAGALRATMLYVMSNKRVQDKLQAEIDEAVRQGKAPAAFAANGEHQIVSLVEAKQLPYLQAVIREGLRIFPPVRNLLPKNIPANGDTVMIDGKEWYLPPGLDIGLSALAMHHDKKLYGEDADVFRPERWLCEPDPDKLAAMTKVNDMSFGHGRWQCLGKNIALMELNKTLFEVSPTPCLMKRSALQTEGGNTG
jgi:cytochrome P450